MTVIRTLLLLLLSIKLMGQCSTTTNHLPDYSLLIGQETVSMSIIDEISGITYNNITEEYMVVSDDGKLARRSTSGNWTDIDINDWTGNNCSTTNFGDIEGITYMNQVSANAHRYAIAEERERVITFVNISNNQTSLNYPDNSYLTFEDITMNGTTCGNNSGIEGVAYNANTNEMYFGIQKNDPIIYTFDVPDNISGQSIDPDVFINLNDLNMNIATFCGLSLFENGNILVMATLFGPESDGGLFNRIMLEFDPCGNLLSQKEIEPTVPNSAELEGIVVVGNDISVIGELGVFYTIEKQSTSTTNHNCNATANDISTYTTLISEETIPTSLIDEVSGLTYNDVTEEFLVVSDDGGLGRRNTSGTWTKIAFNDWSGNSCDVSRFSDTEAITYVGQVSSDTHRYAIAEERERFITFVDIADNQTSLDYPDFSFLRFNGISFTAPECGANNGIEGLAFNANSNTMYFGIQDDPVVYKFEIPSNIVGQSITPTPLIDLDALNLNIHSLLGMDVFDNGNILVLASLTGIGNDGLFDRVMLEFDPCGNLISQLPVEAMLNDSSELEGIVVTGNNICLTGEYGVMYHIGPEVFVNPTCPDLTFDFAGTLEQADNMVTISNASVMNTGTAVADNYVVTAYLSANLDLENLSDATIGDVSVVENHNMNTPHYFSFTFDSSTFGLPSGNYFVVYMIDPIDNLAECNEMNNLMILSTDMVGISSNSNCELTKTMNDNPIASGTYTTQVSIYSQGKVDDNTDVTFNAGAFISLEAGFEVALNAEFTAIIEGCN